MSAAPPHFYEFVRTRLGEAAIVWLQDGQNPRIVRICLPAPERETMKEIRRMFPGATAKSCRAVATLAKGIRTFMEGKTAALDAAAIDMSRVPPYHRKVLAALATIPRGSVISYGAIASKTGNPFGARAVGQGCAKNPFPILFPCHRVVRTDGSLGGFGGGTTLKRALLEMEGVPFDPKGKVKPGFVIL